jgi:hypothetical protein
MHFERDPRYAAEVGPFYGEYLTTYTSVTGQVRAYLFRQGGKVTAHVMFPTGLFASRVTDPCVTDLWQYAREQGFDQHSQMILSLTRQRTLYAGFAGQLRASVLSSPRRG